jgi:hypothetical protein
MLRTFWGGFALVTVALAPAFAEDNPKPGEARPPNWKGSSHVVVVEPLEAFSTEPAAATISPYIYLNRCTAGCSIQYGTLNDARTNTSSIPKMGAGCPGYPTCVVQEYQNAAGETGAAADAEWNEVVQCLKEVYSPFAVTVTDQKPTNGVSYTMALIAGKPGNIGLGDGILGIAPLAGDCSAQDNVISFSFANHHGTTDRVWNLCWTAAQEIAHALGLDHEYMFSDGTSACNDPMTYRFDCGGQKFFRNKPASCGEDSVRPCQCGGSQNSHVKIKGVFGEGTSLIAAPTVVVNSPVNGGTAIPMQIVGAQAGSARGVAKVELLLNGFKWAEVPGALFGSQGQRNPSDYVLKFPPDVPDGVIDIVVKASDDLGISTMSNTITVTKGAPCASAATCAKGQKCEAGKCFWDPPTGKIGASCDYNQFCESGICLDTSDGGLCSQDCIVGVADGCPATFECLAVGTGGRCVPADDGGGCCSVASKDDGNLMWLHVGLSAAVFGFVVRRKRRRR